MAWSYAEKQELTTPSCASKISCHYIWHTHIVLQLHVGLNPCDGETGIIQDMGSANERTCYTVMPSLIGQAQTQNVNSMADDALAPRISAAIGKPRISSLGADSIKRCHLTRIEYPIVEIKQSYDHLISTMGFPLLVRWHLHIEQATGLDA